MLDTTLTVILAIITYVLGMLVTLFLLRSKESMKEATAGYSKLKGYEEALIDMMLRLDMIEMRLRSQTVSQQRDVSHVIHHDSIESKPEAKARIEDIDAYILRLLKDGSRTSRELEAEIGRSREHTARLMKRLYELGYVTRDTTDKPYRYTITELGKKMIHTKA